MSSTALTLYYRANKKAMLRNIRKPEGLDEGSDRLGSIPGQLQHIQNLMDKGYVHQDGAFGLDDIASDLYRSV